MPEPPTNVAQWLPAARAGSMEALGQALEAYRNYLLLIANSQLDPELRVKGGASDLVQETFLEAQRDFAQFQGSSAAELQAWLRQLLLNNLATFARRFRQTHKRQMAREVSLDAGSQGGREAKRLVADTSSPSGQAMAEEQIRVLQHALARLPEDYRRVVTCRYQEGLSFAEIAQRLQRSENAVRKLWFRAIERMEQELQTPP